VPRPTTITGLLSRWLRLSPWRPARAAAAAAGLAASLVAVSFASCGDRCRVQQRWDAGLAEFDYLQSLDLTRSDRGRYTFGESQVVRFDVEFRYRVLDDDVLELKDFVEIDPDGTRQPRDWPARKVRFETTEGDYCFEPPYGGRRCFACRLALRALLPGGYDDYYGCAK
jgi:hypothetical protein